MSVCKRRGAILVLGALALCAPSLFCQVPDDLSATVDLTATVMTLAKQLESGTVPDIGERYVILDGTYTDMLVYDAEGGYVIIQLTRGEWIDQEDVVSYHCLVLLQGESYLAMFPMEEPDEEHPDVIRRHSRLLVVARPLDIVELYENELLWLLDGVYVRAL